MNTINKQKFLAELGKLLTFMYEEDRQTALAMYVKMFEDAEDEQALLQALVSPTRQAVIVARAYNAKTRKLQVEAQSRGEAGDSDDDAATADFILAIHRVYQEAVPVRSDSFAPMEDQFSLFEEDMLPEEEPELFLEEDVETPEPEVPAVEVPEEPTVPPVSAAAPPIPEVPEEPEIPAVPEIADAPAAEVGDDPAAPLSAPADEDVLEETPADPDTLDEFLANFSIEDDPLIDGEETAAPLADVPESAPVKEFEPDAEADTDVFEDAEEEDVSPAGPQRTVRRARPLLLILYIILAIPITLALVAVLLIPTLLFLALAAAGFAACVAFLTTAFSGFPVLADILIVLGAALIALALGLLFMWIFIRFIVGAIAGLIRGVVSLGAKWCYKEVAA